MMGNCRILIVGFVILASWATVLSGGVSNGQPPADRSTTSEQVEGVAKDKLVKAATDKGLDMLFKAGRNWQKNKSCFSCHHQPLPMFAMVVAAETGFQVDAAWLKSQADFTHDYFKDRVERMKAGKHVPGGSSTVEYGLWSLQLVKRPPDETTEAMVSYLLQSQGLARLDDGVAVEKEKQPVKLPARIDGPWLPSCSRPPLTASRVGTTVLALIGMKHYATKEQRPAVEKATEAAEKWLGKAPLRGTEDHFWRLWELHQFGGDAATTKQIREAIVAAQRKDGGWAQEKELESDAYATGQMLFVLRETGSNRDDPVARRAAAYLLRTQHKDGSWLVESRLKFKAQPYFDNGDPHGEHQFLSVAATSWATAACLRMLPPKVLDDKK